MLKPIKLRIKSSTTTRTWMSHLLNYKPHTVLLILMWLDWLDVRRNSCFLFADNNDGVQFYCAKNLFPCLGDHKYSNLIKKINNMPFLGDMKNFEPRPQELHPMLMNVLSMNSYMNVHVPMHLHLSEINLNKAFKKQKIIANIQSPLPEYFSKTLSCLNLDLSKSQSQIKTIENKTDWNKNKSSDLGQLNRCIMLYEKGLNLVQGGGGSPLCVRKNFLG